MKIAVMQSNIVAGDVPDISKKILDFAKTACQNGVRLIIVSPELYCGPFAAYYWKNETFIRQVEAEIHHLAAELPEHVSILLGYAGRRCLLDAGECVYVPDNFIFDGYKFFCCDEALYRIEDHIDRDVDCILYLKSMPYIPGAVERLSSSLASLALSASAWVIWANMVGGYDTLVYPGLSRIFDREGKLRAKAPAFDSGSIQVDLDENLSGVVPPCHENEDSTWMEWQALVSGTRDFVIKSGAKSCVIGLSGGMDSSMVACVAVDALGNENVTGVLMPSPFSSEASVEDAIQLAKNLKIHVVSIPISSVMETFSVQLAPVFAGLPNSDTDNTFENLQARIRGVLLASLANKNNSFVLNTSNKSEAAMGYCTMYGDTVGALSVIGDILKTRVYELAAWYNNVKGFPVIPENIFVKEPSAELRPNQKDSDSLPPYDQLDAAIREIMTDDESEFGSRLVKDVRKRIHRTEFKRRQTPPVLQMSRKLLNSCEIPLTGKMPE